MTASAPPLPTQRTLEELKAEAQVRADRNGYPLVGIAPENAREALGSLTSLDPDEWAEAWSKIGDRYMERAEGLASRPSRSRSRLSAYSRSFPRRTNAGVSNRPSTCFSSASAFE